MSHADWLWIPVTLWAALAQTVRNAAQRSLTADLGTLGATLVRFLYGLPFAALWLVFVLQWTKTTIPEANPAFYLWVLAGSVSQIVATALLLRTMEERNFALAVAYSKSEVVQVALFGFAFLGDPVSAPLALAVASGTLGVLLLSTQGLRLGWAARPALLGLASGAGFALASVGYRGAALALPGAGFLMAAAFTLLVAQALQTALLGGFLLVKNPGAVVKAAKQWRRELAGMALLALGVAAITLLR